MVELFRRYWADTIGHMGRTTDGQTDGRTKWFQYTPPYLYRGGINTTMNHGPAGELFSLSLLRRQNIKLDCNYRQRNNPFKTNGWSQSGFLLTKNDLISWTKNSTKKGAHALFGIAPQKAHLLKQGGKDVQQSCRQPRQSDRHDQNQRAATL